MEEVWKPVTGLEKYKVSNFGNIIGPSGKSLSLNCLQKGYVRVGLGGKYARLHRIVAHEFLGMPEDPSMVVNHKNGIRNDNRAENLEWVSTRENSTHASRNKMVGASWCRFKQCWASKIEIDRKTCHLGYYKNQIDAHQAYMRVLNFMGLENKYAKK